MKSVVSALALLVCVGCSTTTPERSCRFDADCKTSAWCSEGYCESGVCRERQKPDQVLPDDKLGNCLRPACQSGHVTIVPDTADKPDDLRDCRIPDCSSLSNYRQAPDGTACTPGTTPFCATGVCKGAADAFP